MKKRKLGAVIHTENPDKLDSPGRRCCSELLIDIHLLCKLMLVLKHWTLWQRPQKASEPSRNRILCKYYIAFTNEPLAIDFANDQSFSWANTPLNRCIKWISKHIWESERRNQLKPNIKASSAVTRPSAGQIPSAWQECLSFIYRAKRRYPKAHQKALLFHTFQSLYVWADLSKHSATPYRWPSGLTFLCWMPHSFSGGCRPFFLPSFFPSLPYVLPSFCWNLLFNQSMIEARVSLLHSTDGVRGRSTPRILQKREALE